MPRADDDLPFKVHEVSDEELAAVSPTFRAAKTKQERIERAIDVEAAKFAKIEANVSAACEDGRITPDEAARRIEKAEQWLEGRIAWIKGKS